MEVVAERFPDTDVAVVNTAVREAFADLHGDASIEAHLLAVRRLEADGHRFQPATLAPQSDGAVDTDPH